MATITHIAALLLADGRGGDPNAIGGVLLIAGIILLAALTVLGIWILLTRRIDRTEGERGPRRRSHDPGHVGRSE